MPRFTGLPCLFVFVRKVGVRACDELLITLEAGGATARSLPSLCLRSAVCLERSVLPDMFRVVNQ